MDGLKGPYDFDVQEDTPDGIEFERTIQKNHKKHFIGTCNRSKG